MNNVCVIGRITKDIELRATQSGMSAISMFIAINNGKDQDGNDRPADFPKVYVYDKQAENVSKYCHKGSQIAVTGRIKTRTWDREDGTKGYETYILANRVQFLDTKKSENANIPEPDYTPTNNEENTKPSTEEDTDPFKDFGDSIEISDNELPF